MTTPNCKRCGARYNADLGADAWGYYLSCDCDDHRGDTNKAVSIVDVNIKNALKNLLDDGVLCDDNFTNRLANAIMDNLVHGGDVRLTLGGDGSIYLTAYNPVTDTTTTEVIEK